MRNAQNEILVGSVDQGFLALAAAIIMQAVEDVRLHLQFPEFYAGPGGKAAWNARSRSYARQVAADRAAKWLQGNECAELAGALESCGHKVPLRRLFRELQELKKKEVKHG